MENKINNNYSGKLFIYFGKWEAKSIQTYRRKYSIYFLVLHQAVCVIIIHRERVETFLKYN